MKLEKKMLSKTQIDQYNKDGFVVPDFKMPENIINKIEKSLSYTGRHFQGKRNKFTNWKILHLSFKKEWLQSF